MRRPRAPSAEELTLWHRAMRDVTPLAGRAAPRLPPPVAAAAPPAAVSPPPAIVSPSGGGIDAASLRRLAKGERRIDAVLDLHGMTLTAAHAALGRFVQQQAAAERRCLLVITGKGGPDRPGRLRREVPLWLEGWRPPVLAVSAAQPRHGGAGAFYVLLKRRR